MNAIKTKRLSEAELQLDFLLSEFETNRAELIRLSMWLKKLGYKTAVCNTLRSIVPYDCIAFSVRHNVYGGQSHSVFVAGNAKDIALMGELISEFKKVLA